ncbi:MAG: MATE family efflux transporter [Lachnospiraceae bacterium]
MKSNNRMQLLQETKMSEALFKLGIPIVISMLVTALYNVVDTYFVSGLGTTAVAAVSVAFPISLVFSGLGLTFGVGGGSYISRLIGGKQKEQAEKVASTALITGGIAAVIIAILMIIFLTPLLKFMGATETSLPIAKSYAYPFIISTIFSAINSAAGNLAVSQGTTTVSMIGMITGAVVNIILDPLLIYTCNMGVFGAALATLIAQVITLCFYLVFFKGGRSYLKFKVSNFAPLRAIYQEIIKIGLSMLFLQVLSSISMSLITKGASAYGDEAVAALGVVLRVITIGSNVIFGYMKGFQPMAGYNFGAKNYDRLLEAIRCSIKWTTLFGILWTVVAWIIASPLISAFGSVPQFIEIGVRALRVNTLMFITFGFQFTYSTLYLALGKAAPGMVLNLSRQGIFFIPVILILPLILGLDGVIFAQVIADALTTVLTLLMARKIHKEIQGLKMSKTPQFQ